MTVKNKNIIYWVLEVIYAIVFGLIIGVGFGFDVSGKLKKHFG